MKWRIVWVASFRSRLWIHKRQNLLSIAIAGQHLSIIRQVYGLCFHPNRRFSHVICCFVSYPDSGLGSKHRKWINIALSYYIKHSAAPVWLLTYKFDVARPACSMGCLGEGSPPPELLGSGPVHWNMKMCTVLGVGFCSAGPKILSGAARAPLRS